MSKFKVGDIVVGNREASKHYGITKEGWKGRVIGVLENGRIRAEGISEDTTPYFINEKFFDLVTEEKQNKTEMKGVFEVGDIVIGRKPVGDPEYAITGEGWVGEVVCSEQDEIIVRSLGSREEYRVNTIHFYIIYKKSEYCVGSRKFLVEAYKEGINSFMPKIRAILALDPISDLLPVPKSLIDEALCSVCSDWKKKIIEEFKYNDQNPYFNFGKNSDQDGILYTIRTHFNDGPIMIGYGMVPFEEKNRCILVSAEYELIVEDFGEYKKLKFKKK